MRHGRTRHSAWLALLSLACGAPFSPDDDPIATLHVKLDLSNTGIAHPHYRAALAWLTPTSTDGLRLTMQDVDLTLPEPSNSSEYYVRIMGPPPVLAMRSFKAYELEAMAAKGIDTTMVSAVAELLVYHDGNGNRTLDVGPGIDLSPDKVVGRAKGMRIWYLHEGRPAPLKYRAYFPVEEGLSVRWDPTSEDPLPGACTVWDQGVPTHGYCERSSNADGRELDDGEVVRMTMAHEEPAISSYTCAGFWGAGYNTSDEWPDFYAEWSKRSSQAETLCKGVACHCPGEDCAPELPPKHGEVALAPAEAGIPAQPPDGEVFCAHDLRAYAWKTCTTDADRCNQKICHYGHGEYPPGTDPPEDWPCTEMSSTKPRGNRGQPAGERPPPLGEDRDALGSRYERQGDSVPRAEWQSSFAP